MAHIHERIDSTSEHHALRWCDTEELDRLQPPMTQAVKWYCRKAIEEIGAADRRSADPPSSTVARVS